MYNRRWITCCNWRYVAFFKLLVSSAHWKHWPCLLPQHGPARKHTAQLVRGLIHSDGYRGVNRIEHPRRTYEYVRYQFTTRSDAFVGPKR